MKLPQLHSVAREIIAFVLFVAPAGAQQKFWEPASGTFVGTKVNAVTFLSDTIGVAASNNGLFRSSDAGETWVLCDSGLTDTVVLSLMFDSRVGFFAGTRYGVCRSTDSGVSWLRVPGLPQIGVYSMLSNSQGFAFAATDSGVYRSTDSGDSWAPTTSGLPLTQMSSLAINTAGELYCGAYNGGVFRSANNGATWTQTGLEAPYVHALVVSSTDSVFAWAAGSIYRSGDRGATWSAFPFLDVNSIATTPSGSVFIGTKFCTISPNCGLYQPGGLFGSTDDGSTWEYLGFRYSQFRVVSSNIENRVFGQFDNGALYRSSDDGLTWRQNSLLIGLVGSLMSTTDGTIFAGGRDGCFRSSDRGNTWTNSSPEAYEVRALGSTQKHHIFAATDGARVYRSTDSGTTWVQLSLGLQPYHDVIAFASDSDGYVYAGTYQEGIFRSSDEGEHWTQVVQGLGNFTVRSLHVAPSGDVLAGTDVGMYRSSSHGDSWSRLDGGLIGSVQTIQTFQPAGILAGTYLGGIYRSEDDGLSWVTINSGLTDLDVRSLVCVSPATFFAGTSGGVFASIDSGNSWITTNTGLPNNAVTSLAHNPDGKLFAATWGGGVYRSRQIISSVRESEGSLPISYSLAQNYPNPFNSGTTIQFSIAHAEFVTIEIFNSLGQRVATPVSDYLAPGVHVARWDASRYASGAYYCKMSVGGYIATRNIVLIK